MQVGELAIKFKPGSTYEEDQQNPDFMEKDEKRRLAVREFQHAAQRSTQQQLNVMLEQVLGMVLQLRSIGGTGAGTDLPKKLRECADFLEDM